MHARLRVQAGEVGVDDVVRIWLTGFAGLMQLAEKQLGLTVSVAPEAGVA